jgi:hypothetical protein
VAFALKQSDKEKVGHALCEVQTAKRKLMLAQEKILQEIQNQRLALNLFEESLRSSLERLDSQGDDDEVLNEAEASDCCSSNTVKSVDSIQISNAVAAEAPESVQFGEGFVLSQVPRGSNYNIQRSCSFKEQLTPIAKDSLSIPSVDNSDDYLSSQ